jgi:Protein of unknown function (DUF968).
MMKHPRVHNEKHLQFIRQLPCVVCEDNTSTEAAHIRFSDARAAKINPGVGAKPHDRWTVPLCGKHHRKQHEMNEQGFWDAAMIDPIFVALALWSVSGDHEAGEEIIRAQH